MSFTFIACGAFFAVFYKFFLYKNIFVQKEHLIVGAIVIGVAFGSQLGVFLGPIGDAQAYNENINSCFGVLPPCGGKFHVIFWAFFSSVLGPVWGALYGFVVVCVMSNLAVSVPRQKKHVLLRCMLYYSAYQVGNGMAEGTYSLLGYAAVLLIYRRRILLGCGFVFATIVAHLGNLPMVLYLFRFKRGLGFLLALFLCFAGLLVFGVVDVDFLFSVVNKASALVDIELVKAALEAKLRVSIRDASTSYGAELQLVGFPYLPVSWLYAVLIYIAPVVVLGSGMGFVVAVLSTLMSISIIFVAKNSYLLMGVVLLSFILFGLASYTPGIGLRHKVPLFIFVLSVSQFRYASQVFLSKLKVD